jgi:hypothetical protein
MERNPSDARTKMNKAGNQRKMINLRHPLTKGPSAQDARKAADD